MLNRKSLAWLAAITLVLLVISAAIGEDHDFLVIGDDILFVALILCVVTLIVSSVIVLIRAAVRSRGG